MTSYCPVPLFVMMSEETGDPKYRQAAIRAADYVWSSWVSANHLYGITGLEEYDPALYKALAAKP